MRRSATAALLLLIVSSLAVLAPAAAAADTRAPKIVSARMVDSDSDGKPDRVKLTYNEAVRYRKDLKAPFAFKVTSNEADTSVKGYRVQRVGAAKGKVIVIVFRENNAGDPTPSVKYTKPGSNPVRDLAGNAAKSQLFTRTIGLEAARYTLTVNPPENGRIVSTPAGIDCGATCSATYDKGAEVTLEAIPEGNAEFVAWTGDCATVTTQNCTLFMNANRTVGATFQLPDESALTVTKTGSGRVTSSPAGIDCGTTCTKSFTNGSQVTLTAVPEGGTAAKFLEWGGACAGTTSTCTVTMDAAKTVTAKFAYILTVTKSGNGSVVSTPAGIACASGCATASFGFAPGTNVSLAQTADTATQSAFVGWGGACTGAAACSVAMDANKTVNATFGYTLTVTRTGNGTGTITATGLNCSGTTCTGVYPANTDVQITAAPQATGTTASNFAGWGGACQSAGTQTQCHLSMNQGKTASASFVLKGPWDLQVTDPAPSGKITSNDGKINCGIDPGGPGSDCSEADGYAGGQTVTLTATPAGPLFAFESWTGACAGVVTNTCTLTMDGDKTVGATFSAVSTPSMSVDQTGANAGTGTVLCTVGGVGGSCNGSIAPGTPVVVTATQAGFPVAGAPSISGCPATPVTVLGVTTCSFTMPSSDVPLTVTFP